MDKEPSQGRIRRWAERFTDLDSALSAIERAWSLVPKWLRGVLATVGTVVVTAMTGVLSATLAWGGGFVQDYGVLAVLVVLGSMGAATIVRGLGDRLVAALNRQSDARMAEERLAIADDRLPPGDPPTVEEVATTRAIRAAFAPHWGVCESMQALMFDVQREVQENHPYAALLNGPLSQLGAATKALTEALDESHDSRLPDLEERVRAFLSAYTNVVRLLLQSAAYGVDLTDTAHGDEYEKWETAHEALVSDVTHLIGGGGLPDLRKAAHQLRRQLPCSKSLWARNRARARLMDLSEREREALEIMFVREALPDPDRKETFAPTHFLKSASTLEEHGVIKHERLRDGTHLFRVPRPALEPWMDAGLPTRVRTTAVISESAIKARFVGGSGAGS